jgi:hemerythrin-like domain-containing protein
MAKKSTNQLRAEHQRILQALEVLREMTEQIEGGSTVSREDVLDLLKSLQCFAHEYHDRKEHCVLLPILAGLRIRTAEVAAAQIEADHSGMHDAIYELNEALVEGTNADFLEAAQNYIERLTTHVFTEDRFIFTTVEKTLSDAEDDELVKAFASFDPALREYSSSIFENVVPRLAQKYGMPQCV